MTSEKEPMDAKVDGELRLHLDVFPQRTRMYSLREVVRALEKLKDAGYDLDRNSVLEQMTVHELIVLAARL